jgi:hypothetical protein
VRYLEIRMATAAASGADPGGARAVRADASGALSIGGGQGR